MKDNYNSPIEYFTSHYYNMNLNQFAKAIGVPPVNLYKAARRKTNFENMNISMILAIKSYDKLVPLETTVAHMILSQRVSASNTSPES